MSRNILHNADTWGVNVTGYNDEDWGKASAEFKVPNTIIIRFRKTIFVDESGVEVPEGSPDAIQREVFDVDKAFKNIAYIIIQSIVSQNEILKTVQFGELLEEDRRLMRLAVYAGIEHASLNNAWWEKVNTSSASTSSFSFTSDSTNWLLSNDIMGMKASNIVDRAQLYDYSWQSEEELVQFTENGNTRVVIGKIDVNLIPELVNT